MNNPPMIELPETELIGQVKVLVGNSVMETASATIREGVLHLEFDAEDLDDLAIDLEQLRR